MKKEVKEIVIHYKIIYSDNTIKLHNFKITGSLHKKKLIIIHNKELAFSTITEILKKLNNILRGIK